MEAFIKKHPIPIILATALLVGILAFRSGVSSAQKALRARVLDLIQTGKYTDAIKLLGGTSKGGEGDAP